ncbi:MAG: hypothetical protein IJV14_06885 [Lachnospiraceae bacterium]|nr:hypothetical protein [Lachnospiraceae bacterium]
MKYEPKIEMPTKQEIDESVQLILAKGLPQSPRFEFKRISVRNVLFGIEDCVLIAFMIYIAIMSVFSLFSSKETPFIPLQFIIAPLLFAILMYLSLWKDVMNKTAEWKQVCRINYKYLTIYRMVLFGGASVIVNTGSIYLTWKLTGGNYSFLWILSFSFASLFLYGFFSLLLLNRNIKHGIIYLSILWVCAGLAMFLYKDIMTLTVIIPLYVIVLIFLAAALGLFYQTREYLLSPMKGDVLNAYN